jgi:16S rRNA (uracil1498-N3)-methyltransferase
MTTKIRLCLDHPLGPGQSLPLTEAQAHYLFGVMREGPGSQVLAFNGRDGEWLSEVTTAGRRSGTLMCRDRIRPQADPPDLWLMFAPVKKARTDFIVEKAVELGAARIVPVQTDFTNSERIRQDRLQAHATEAAEQCGALAVPPVTELVGLGPLLAGWPVGRRILWADESRLGPAEALASAPNGPWAILIGPEGGFSPAERARLRGLPFVLPVALGPRILRADTAVCAAMTLWQAALGDWRR